MNQLHSGGICLILLAGMTFLLYDCHKDTVEWDPEVLLVMKPDSGLTTQTFNFTVDITNLPKDQSEFYIRWDLNGDSLWDAPFSASPSITHRFYQKGIQTVKTEILTKDGKRLILNKSVSVTQGYSAPHASFTIDPPESHYMTEFTFNAGSTFDDEDALSLLQFRWDFDDDGVWDTNSSSDPVSRHRYKRSGTYTPKLSVTDPTKRTSIEIQTLLVTMHDSLISPEFIWSPTDATVKDTFLLDASATHHETDSSKVFSYLWYIRGEVSYGPFADPVFAHMFWQAGKEQITLTVTDEFGLSNSITKELYVIKENKPPTPAIQASTPYGNIASSFFISAWLSTDDVTPPSKMLIRWDFEGDGTWDTGWSYDKTLFHQFSEPGTYWLTLEAEDEGGESATTKKELQVSPYSNPTGYIFDKRDSKYYGTVKIRDQWWMTDNLDYRTNPKMNIPMLQKCFSEASGQCDLYGALYQGERAASYVESGQNICPDGWRVPTKADWLKLGTQIPATGGRDAMLVGGSLGFNATYTGYGYYHYEYKLETNIVIDTIYVFKDFGKKVQYLSATTRSYFEEGMSQFYMGVQNDFEGVDLTWGNLNGYFYVRCVKDE